MLICSSWVASQSLPANSSKMAAWGGRRRPRGDPAELQKSNVRNAHTPRRRPQNKYQALCPQPQKTGVGPSDGWSRSREGASRRGRLPRASASGASLEITRLTAQTLPPARPLRPPTRLCSAQRQVPRHLKSTDGGRWKPRV